MRKRGERMYKILIIEDDCGIALGIEKSLQSWGFKTKCVTDFSNVLVDFSQYKPHLILLDISLPFLTAIIGAVKSEKFQKCRLFLFRLHQII